MIQQFGAADEKKGVRETRLTLNGCGADGTRHSVPVAQNVAVRVLPEYRQSRVCARCQQNYQELNNFGHKCSYHPFPPDSHGVHRCCNLCATLSLGKYNGCVPCDHCEKLHWSTTLGDKNCFISQVPVVLFAFLSPPPVRVIGMVTSFAEEQQPLYELFSAVDICEPHAILSKTNVLVMNSFKPTQTALAVQAWTTLNEAVRYEDDNIDYYTPQEKDFTAYAIVLRCSSRRQG